MKTTFSVAANQHQPFGYTVKSGDISLDFDVPEMFKGKNSAPDPHFYLNAALIACKAITGKMYAMQKKYPLEDISIEMEADASQERKGKYITNLKVTLIGSELSAAQREEIHGAMQHCPIHKLLSDDVEVEVNSSLTD